MCFLRLKSTAKLYKKHNLKYYNTRGGGHVLIVKQVRFMKTVIHLQQSYVCFKKFLLNLGQQKYLISREKRTFSTNVSNKIRKLIKLNQISNSKNTPFQMFVYAFIVKCKSMILSKRHFLKNQLYFGLFKNLLKTV